MYFIFDLRGYAQRAGATCACVSCSNERFPNFLETPAD